MMTTAADWQNIIEAAYLYKRLREADDDELEADAASVPDDQEKTTSV